MTTNDEPMRDEELFGEWFPSDRKPWERMPGESTKAYAAFMAYLLIDPPHERTLPLAASIFYEKPIEELTDGKRGKVVPGQFRAWKTEWTWEARAKAYDFWNTRESLEAMRDARTAQAREEGVDLAKAEANLFHSHSEFYEKIVEAVRALPTQNPTWKNVTDAFKPFNEGVLTLYKINKYKHDMKEDGYDGLSEEEMDRFLDKKPPKEKAKEEMERLGSGSEEQEQA